MKFLIYFVNTNNSERYILHYLKQQDNSFVIKYKNEKDFMLFKPDRAIVVVEKNIEKLENLDIFITKCQALNVFTGLLLFDKYKLKHNIPLIYRIKDTSDIIHTSVPKFLNDLVNKRKTEQSNLSALRYDDLAVKHKVHIYIPTYYRFLKTKKSIESILKLAEESKHDIRIFIGDNNSKDEEMQTWLSGLKITVLKNEVNLGKAGIVNKLHSIYKTDDIDFVFSIDSDMKKPLDVEYNTFDKMIEILNVCDNVGLVSSNQLESCHHWFNRTVFVKNNNNYKLGYSQNGIGIAGGCIAMKAEDWNKIGGYKSGHDIYTGDDSILTYNVDRILCKDPVVAVDYYMVHPDVEDEKEKAYQEWKNKSWMRDNVQFVKDDFTGSNKLGFWD